MIINEENNTYHITEKKSFNPHILLSPEDIDQVFNFANQMTFKEVGAHRNHRSGGNIRRKKAEIFADTFQGKIAEVGFYNYFRNGNDITVPDFNVAGLGEWDLADFYMNNQLIAVKSTKKFGNLLLLETKDWDRDGRYIPNINTGHARYDYIYLVRVSASCSDIFKSERMLYSNVLDMDEVYNLITNKTWEIEITGFITHNELVQNVIRAEQIIPQNALLNGSTRMDASNYYVEAGNLNSID